MEFAGVRFKALDGFKGLASLMILSFHVLSGAFAHSQYLHIILVRMRIGTDIFFVISGYGISVAAHKIIYEGKPVKGFISKRIKRIYLCYVLSLFFAALVIPSISSFVSYFKSHSLEFSYCKYSLFEWVKILTLTRIFDSNNWMLNEPFLPLNGVYWFIAVIVQIYLMVAVALVYKRYYYKIITIITLLSLSCLLPGVKYFVPSGLFLPKWCEFAVGMVLFHIIRKFPSPNRLLYSAVWVVTIMLGYITFTVSMSSDAYRFLSAVFIGGVFWSIYPFDNVISNSGIFYLFKFLGSFSYSTYLLHIPLWPFVGMFIRNFVTLNYTISGPLILLPSILAASYLWHLFFERPDSISSVVYALLHPLNTIQIGIAKEIHGQTGYRAKEAYCAAVNN